MALNLLAGMQIHSNSFAEAADMLLEALDNAGDNREVQVRTLLLLSFAQLNTGDFTQALQQRRAGRELRGRRRQSRSDQPGAVDAGDGRDACADTAFDEDDLQPRTRTEEPDSDAPIAFRASANCALLMAWAGRLDEASEQMAAVRRRCIERGAETDLIFVSFFTTLIEIWRGQFADAASVAEETVERPQQLGGDHLRVVALTVQAVVAAYTGRRTETREAAVAAIELAQRCGSPRLADWSSISLGFLEVSLGNYAEALDVLQPLIARFDQCPAPRS